VPTAVLAAVLIARKKERVCDVTAESPRDVNEPREADDGGPGYGQPFRSHESILIGLDDLGFAVDHETKGALHRNHRQWLERSVQRQAP
jgi:hypothetical protein